ncbi:hypothetical protein WEI85_01605 [Actinomycetes bacterium KLBMP 9797]
MTERREEEGRRPGGDSDSAAPGKGAGRDSDWAGPTAPPPDGDSYDGGDFRDFSSEDDAHDGGDFRDFSSEK